MTDPLPGKRVRIRTSPTQIGVLTGRSRPRGTIRVLQVEFPGGTRWVADDQLEDVTGQREHPVDLLAGGKLGTAADLRRTLTHRRLTGRLADVIYSMEATNTDFYAYQFKPALKLLAAPTNGMLIADEVGLGKTIEAALIWTELKIRYDLRRLLVVCPASLREKWRLELRSKFGIDARLEDAEGLLRALAEEKEQRRGFAVIASIQGLRPPKGWEDADGNDGRSARAALAAHLRAAESAEPIVDLLIIDEAHHLRNRETLNHALGVLLRDVSEFKLLLTATPIHTGNDDLFAALELLDPDTFQRRDTLGEILDANRPLVEMRDRVLRGGASADEVRAALHEALGHSLLRGNRQIGHLLETLPGDEDLRSPEVRSRLAYRIEHVNLLAHTITRTRKRDVLELRVVREPQAQRVEMSAYERRFYDGVTALVREYARRHDVIEGFLLATPQRQLSSSMAAALHHWLERRDELEEEDDSDVWDTDRAPSSAAGPLTRWLASRAGELADPARLESEDTKFVHLAKQLKSFLRKDRGAKVVVFTSYRATQAYLARRLDAVGIRSLQLSGRSAGEGTTKEDIVEQFRARGGPSVLISTEVGGEGIDLQFSRFLVNYDLPWNPMRVEQRIGRLDRIGQTAKTILIWNIFHAKTIDDRIYASLYDRLDLCRRSLGDFEPILGEHVRALTRRLLNDELTPAQERERIDQTAAALERLRLDHEVLEDQARHLVAYGDLILDRVRAAHELNRWIDGDDVKGYVTELFRRRFKGCEFLRRAPDADVYDVRLTPEAKRALTEFVEALRLPPTRLAEPGSAAVAVRFVHRAAGVKERGVELVSQSHQLTRFASHEIQAHEEQLTPAVAVRLGSGIEDLADGVYVAVVADWSLKGLVTWQKLAYGAVRLAGSSAERLSFEDAERLVVSATKHGEDWISARARVPLALAEAQANAIADELSRAFELEHRAQEAQNQDRADIQRRGLEQHLVQQEARLVDLRLRHQSHGRDALAKATEGRRSALREKIDRKLAAIDARRAVAPQNDEILAALILVGDPEKEA